MYDERERECHPLLRGGERDENYKNGSLSSSEMESLTSLCEVILQPLPLNSLDDVHHHHHGNKKEESYHLFSTLSGSQHSVPKKVANLIAKRGFFEAVMVVRLVLKLLSTRLGTFFVAGSLCFSHQWPYINKFSETPLHKREKIVQKWFKHSFLTPIRLGFVFIKRLSFCLLFSVVLEVKVGEEAVISVADPWETSVYDVECDCVMMAAAKGVCTCLDSLWYIDSGGSKHMKGCRALLKNFKAHGGGDISFGNNSKGKVLGSGIVEAGKLKFEHVNLLTI